ncbi:MAG: hypothetical protein ACK51A_09735 [Sphingobacteriia bacterium]|jgi:hypothetical protein
MRKRSLLFACLCGALLLIPQGSASASSAAAWPAGLAARIFSSAHLDVDALGDTVQASAADTYHSLGLFLWLAAAPAPSGSAASMPPAHIQDGVFSLGILLSLVILFLIIGVLILLFGIYKGNIRLKS